MSFSASEDSAFVADYVCGCTSVVAEKLSWDGFGSDSFEPVAVSMPGR